MSHELTMGTTKYSMLYAHCWNTPRASTTRNDFDPQYHPIPLDQNTFLKHQFSYVLILFAQYEIRNAFMTTQDVNQWYERNEFAFSHHTMLLLDNNVIDYHKKAYHIDHGDDDNTHMIIIMVIVITIIITIIIIIIINIIIILCFAIHSIKMT